MKKILAFLKNTGEKIQNTHQLLQIIAFSVCAAILLAVTVSLAFRPSVRRTLFYYTEAASGKTRLEVRYLPKVRGTDARLAMFTGELVLGPINPGYIPLFSKNVRVLRTFVRSHAAYVDLSAEALEINPGSVWTADYQELFKKNVFTNFGNVDKIYLYMDGIEVYGEIPESGVELKK